MWLGADPVPAIFGYYLESWRRHHPAWEIRLWRDDTLPALSCADRYDTEKGFKKRYDIVRLEIVRQFGGVIVDMDVEAIRPLDPILSGVQAFVGQIGERHIGNQVLGAIPGHPFFEEAIERLRASEGVAGSTTDLAGKEFLKRLLTERPDGVTVFPPETFYFEPSADPPKRPDDFPNVYAVHHELRSYTSPLPQEAIERRFAKFAEAVAAVAQARLAGDAEALVSAAAKQDGAERRLKRGILQQDEGYQAVLRRADIERHQLEAQLRDARDRIAELEARLKAGRPS